MVVLPRSHYLICGSVATVVLPYMVVLPRLYYLIWIKTGTICEMGTKIRVTACIAIRKYQIRKNILS